jgi:hyaluronan synthase
MWTLWNELLLIFDSISRWLRIEHGLLPYLPFGIVGAYRWTLWIVRKILGLRYKPTPLVSLPLTTSVITPVYNEDPGVFRSALESWANNHPLEIIAVIDHADHLCIEEFQNFARLHPNARLIITRIPGKREALATGMNAAKGDIFALVDSDTIWHEKMLPVALSPFADHSVGGVTVRQNVLAPHSLAAKLFDIHLDTRYLDEVRFLAGMGDLVTCISGRTGLYRREAVLPVLEHLLTETFWGQRVISGDDKRLTQLIQSGGWAVRYQENARVYTPAFRQMGRFLQQRLRWARNSWRSDLQALMRKWVWKSPALAIHLLDRTLQPFTTLLAPAYFIIAMFRHDWWLAIALVIWWFISRAIKIFPSLRRHPSYWLLLPAYIVFTYVFAVIRIFALFSMNEQGWITRWDASRFQKTKSALRGSFSYTFTCCALLAIFFLVQFSHSDDLQAAGGALVYRSESEIPGYANMPFGGRSLQVQAPLFQMGAIDVGVGYAPYLTNQESTIEQIAYRYGLEPSQILVPEGGWRLGQLLHLPRTFMTPDQYLRLLHQLQKENRGKFGVKYVRSQDTLHLSHPLSDTVYGRFTVIDLPNLYRQLNNEAVLAYEGDGVYHLKSSLRLKPNVALLIEAPQVRWLKLESNREKFVRIFGNHASLVIDGVRITSWDSAWNTFDTEIEDGRSHLYLKNGRMDILNSELAYLGYKPSQKSLETGVYGLSWRVSDFDIDSFESSGRELATGYVAGNRIHNNYFGIYTFGVTGMIISNNEVYENVLYGIDPHDDSDHLVIEHNHTHHNGTHGIILSKRCTNSIIRWNRSIENGANGIMMDQRSDNNLIYGNTVVDNGDGIVLWDSHDVVIYNNEIDGNRRGIRLNADSSDNGIYENSITNSEQYGLFFYGEAHHNWVWRNRIENNRAGVSIQSQNNFVFNNQILDGDRGVYLTNSATDNQIFNNQFVRNQTGIYLQEQMGNLIRGNVFVEARELRNWENIRLLIGVR